jgi:ATP-binding cassette subfamily C protein LapB
LETLEDKTLLLFTHRTSLLHLVDRVVVMDAGKVVADGPKADILKALKSGQVGAAKR